MARISVVVVVAVVRVAYIQQSENPPDCSVLYVQPKLWESGVVLV